MHLVRHSGVLAPNVKMRKGVIPGMMRAEIKAKRETNLKEKDKKLVCNYQWAKLLARTFAVDVSKCKYCKGELKIINAYRDSAIIEKILTHLGLSPRPPPLAPARTKEMFAFTSYSLCLVIIVS